MNCPNPKCKATGLPDDARFCPDCGCDIIDTLYQSERQKQREEEAEAERLRVQKEKEEYLRKREEEKRKREDEEKKKQAEEEKKREEEETLRVQNMKIDQLTREAESLWNSESHPLFSKSKYGWLIVAAILCVLVGIIAVIIIFYFQIKISFYHKPLLMACYLIYLVLLFASVFFLLSLSNFSSIKEDYRKEFIEKYVKDHIKDYELSKSKL